MSATNIAFVQSLYAAFGRGDIKAVIAGLAADVDWIVNGRRKDYPTLGSWKGQEGVQKFFEGVAEHQEAVEFTPREFFAADDRVCVLGHYAWKIRKTGRSAASDWAHVFTVRNGKVVKFREFTDTAQFAEAYR
jgi:ketosteroid isomerase-like protein